MRSKTSRHYAHLLHMQKLLQKRDESELANLRRNLADLEQENNLLGAMLARGSYADLVDPLLISQRMERNRRSQSQLIQAIDTQIKIWLQSNRRVERMAEKHIQAKTGEIRNQLDETLGEIIVHRLTSRSDR